jgi:hypothetical protein
LLIAKKESYSLSASGQEGARTVEAKKGIVGIGGGGIRFPRRALVLLLGLRVCWLPTGDRLSGTVGSKGAGEVTRPLARAATGREEPPRGAPLAVRRSKPPKFEGRAISKRKHFDIYAARRVIQLMRLAVHPSIPKIPIRHDPTVCCWRSSSWSWVVVVQEKHPPSSGLHR